MTEIYREAGEAALACIRSPGLCFNSSGMSVKLVEIVPTVIRKKVSLKGAINQYTSVFQQHIIHGSH